MGLGPATLALYHQMKILGLFDGIENVLELGAQQVWAHPGEQIKRLYRDKVSGRELYTDLGMNYTCVDLDPSFDSINLDLKAVCVTSNANGFKGVRRESVHSPLR